jgi:hypothetical protein
MKTWIRIGAVGFVVIFLAVGRVMIEGRRLQWQNSVRRDLKLVSDHRDAAARMPGGNGFRLSLGEPDREQISIRHKIR